jgi:hypothetical protein
MIEDPRQDEAVALLLAGLTAGAMDAEPEVTATPRFDGGARTPPSIPSDPFDSPQAYREPGGWTSIDLDEIDGDSTELLDWIIWRE